MRIVTIAAVNLMVVTACETTSPDSCKVTCASDSECPSSQACGPLGLCTAGEVCTCSADEFLGCVGDTARFCNSTSDGFADQVCAAGCNSETGQCEACATCSADGTTLEHCAADGLPSETCLLGCVSGAQPHCGFLEPLYLPDACDLPATGNPIRYDIPITLDTTVEANCTELVPQTAAPSICVIRARRITIASTVTVIGARPIAFVADEAIEVPGTLDASATSETNGPGGGTVTSGGQSAVYLGGGGAGFRFIGGAGGGKAATGSGGGQAGGALLDATGSAVLLGGPQSAHPGSPYPNGGGGGGGVMLVACRGAINVTGVIDANGGGGLGGVDPTSGAGGGAGGYVLLQGTNISIASTGGVFANGGGGGGGCTGAGSCVGNPGQDGQRSTAAALGGPAQGMGTAGGNGATSAAPGPGLNSDYSAGGGGGSSGFLQPCLPAGGQLTNAGTVSPPLSSTKTIPTR